ncbi:hypothetical protein [Agromyces bauzanensis]
MTGRSASEERDLMMWAKGWDAAAAYYWPLLVLANDTADRLYARAFPEPKHVRDRRIGEAVEAAFYEAQGVTA